MEAIGLLVTLEALAGKEADAEAFLRSAQPLALDEKATLKWYAIKLGPGKFGIFDTFANEAGRNAHLTGEIAKELTARASELFAVPPHVERIGPCKHTLKRLSARFYGRCELDAKRSLEMANTTKTAIVTGASQGIGKGTRRSVPETRLQRSRKLAKHYQSKSIPGDRECCTRRRRHRRPSHGRKDCGCCRIPIRPDRCADKQRGYFYSEAFHRIHNRRLQHFSLHDARRLSLRLTALHKTNVAAEIRQHRQCFNHPG